MNLVWAAFLGMCEMLSSSSPKPSWAAASDGVRRNHKGKQCGEGGDSVRVSSFLCSETFSVMEWEEGEREV